MNLSELQYLIDRVRRRLDRINSQVVLGRNSAGVGPMEEITYANLASYLTLSGGLGTGTVTSVGLAAPTIFNVAGSPVTSAGTLTLNIASQPANTVWAGPTSGGSTDPTFRQLVFADMTGLQTALDGKLSLAGGTLTGGLVGTSATFSSGANLATSTLTEASTSTPTGISVQSGPGAGNGPYSWTYPYGAKLSVYQGATRSWELTNTFYPTGSLAFRIGDAGSWSAWKELLDTSTGVTTSTFSSHTAATTGAHGMTSTGASMVAQASTTAVKTFLGAASTSTAIATQHSLTGGGDLSANRTLSLVGDTASPGASKYYGTDTGGNRGWQSVVDSYTKTESDARYSLIGHNHSGVYEPAFAKGNIVAGPGVTITGVLSGRLVGTGDVTIDADIITDHGFLAGLGDDDHPHYLNNARGDARYLQLSGGLITGSLQLSNLGADLSSGAGYKVLMRADSGYGVRGITLGALKGYIDTQIADVPGLQSSLDAKALASRTMTTQHSLTGGGDLSANRTFSLVNDTASPGASKYYGTDGSGVRGWYNLPSGSSGVTAQIVGYFTVSLGTVTGSSGISATHAGSGVYTVTHNLGANPTAILIQPTWHNPTTPTWSIDHNSRGANSFQVVIGNYNGPLTRVDIAIF